MTAQDGATLVQLRRLDALQAAIRARAPWHEVEWLYDQLRSAVERDLGTRRRPVDQLRAAGRP